VLTRDEFAPHVLREYALIADGERGALIGPRGEIVWMCLPRWHDDAVFASLIGGEGGYAVTPEGRFVWGGYYEPGSLIWRSRWITSDGIVECREALAFPGDIHGVVVLRHLIAYEATVRVRVVLDPRAGFTGPGLHSLWRDRSGHWEGRVGSLYLRWTGDVGSARARRGSGEPEGHDVPGRYGRAPAGLVMSLTLRPGEERQLVLELSDRPFEQRPARPARLWQATQRHWEQAVPPLDHVIASRDARHAYAVLRGLTSSSGGMVAAATTSLPERAQAGRNYDYRYAWIRDQCYTGQAAAAAGAYPLLDEAVNFVSGRLLADGPKLAPAYTVDGAGVPDQHRLDLPGYPGGYDLVGNSVNRQFQLDIFGEALLLLATAARHDRLGHDGWQAARIAADAIAARWQEPDAGIWELSDQPWTHSRLHSSAGLLALAATGRAPELADQWRGLAEAIVTDTAAHALHPSGRWQRSPADPGLDAALLLPPVRGALAAYDPRTVATLEAFLAELTEDGYAYRFRHDERPLGEAEGAFLLCGFLLTLALHQQGRQVEAARWFERNRAACGPAGLFSEEYDVAQRQLRGNLPQAFVHALMLECAAALAAPEEGSGKP
jgi:alpha,alpha-trehalase